MSRPPPSLRTIMQHRAAARHNRSMLWASLGLGAMVAWWVIILSTGLYERFTRVGWILSPGLTLYSLWSLFRLGGPALGLLAGVRVARTGLGSAPPRLWGGAPGAENTRRPQLTGSYAWGRLCKGDHPSPSTLRKA
jgi:hypothetical protein